MSAPVLKLRRLSDGTVSTVDHQPAAHWPRYLSSRPARRSRYVTLNCVRYRVAWDSGAVGGAP